MQVSDVRPGAATGPVERPVEEPVGEPVQGPAEGPTEGPVEGLRDRKKRATRRALRLAALRLVAERGLDGVTVDDVAAAADVSTRTFFNYFDGKEQALVGNDPDLAPRLARALRDRPAGEAPVEALRATLTDYARSIVLDDEIWHLRTAVLARHPHLRAALAAQSSALEAALRDVVGERTGLDPQRHPYPALVAGVAVAVVLAAVRHSGGTHRAGRLAEIVDEHFDALARGLVPPG